MTGFESDSLWDGETVSAKGYSRVALRVELKETMTVDTRDYRQVALMAEQSVCERDVSTDEK